MISVRKCCAFLILWLALLNTADTRRDKRCQKGVKRRGKCRTSAVLTKSFGDLRSPGYPRNYTNNIQSSWHIRVPKGYRIKLKFRRFHIEDSTLCHKDALVVAFDKAQRNTRLYCGKRRQRGVTSSSNELWLIFRTDDDGTGKGFYATYSAVDVNECRKEVCKFPSLCRNTVGSYMCDCPDGYRLRGRKNSGRCVDIDECSSSQVKCEFKCVNTAGSYHCVCPKGFRLAYNEKSCRDENECLRNNGGCSHQCRNSRGSYACLCPTGYKLDSKGKTCRKEIFYDYQKIYYVKEDAAIGTLVTTVKAKLAKRNGENLLFSIVAENLKREHPTFKMNITSGELTVNSSLDRETVSEYLLEIEAKHLNPRNSRRSKKARSFVVVRILDVNDNAPMFSYPAYTITVPCNVRPGITLYRIDAYDQDEGKNAQVTFKLEPENPYFTVQRHSGKVKVLQGLREFCNESSSSPLKRFEYKIVATDRGSPALRTRVRVRFIIAAVDLTSQTMFVWYTDNHDVKLVQKSSRKNHKKTDSS
ncbi:uncharacterized protein LOC114517893 [Dendronephthya gigantea]|uniref:uncharacterized protein LOC114517893 n=1 Tax=Dendronephthya gigantea TaxID=151771 RepID=UPI001069ABAB|nr:uncharacterized protein LOC114517893 [Dendronephthya gigantea]